ncbi:MAG: hypothetical protein GF320_21895 [Armatimonadia bacterium]|nr:hypothetical protein [Armatimonadia bacterium]
MTDRPLTALQTEILLALLREARKPELDDRGRYDFSHGRLTPNDIAWQLARTEAGIAQWAPYKIRYVNGRTVRGLLVSLNRRGLLDYDYRMDTSTWYLTPEGQRVAEALEGERT